MTDSQIIAIPFFVLTAICVVAPLLVHHYKQKKTEAAATDSVNKK